MKPARFDEREQGVAFTIDAVDCLVYCLGKRTFEAKERKKEDDRKLSGLYSTTFECKVQRVRDQRTGANNCRRPSDPVIQPISFSDAAAVSVPKTVAIFFCILSVFDRDSGR